MRKLNEVNPIYPALTSAECTQLARYFNGMRLDLQKKLIIITDCAPFEGQFTEAVKASDKLQFIFMKDGAFNGPDFKFQILISQDGMGMLSPNYDFYCARLQHFTSLCNVLFLAQSGIGLEKAIEIFEVGKNVL